MNYIQVYRFKSILILFRTKTKNQNIYKNPRILLRTVNFNNLRVFPTTVNGQVNNIPRIRSQNLDDYNHYDGYCKPL